MGKIWGTGIVAAVVVAAITGSSAPAEQVTQPVFKASAVLSELPASLADTNVAKTPHTDLPDPVKYRWPCKLPMRIYYAGAPGIDSQRILRELAYPVRYLQDLGYDVPAVQEVDYQYDYLVPTGPGDVLLIVATGDDVAKTALGPEEAWGVTEYNIKDRVSLSAKITINGKRGLPSDVLLHELGHVIGLDHKDYTAMTERTLSTGAFDAAETAAIDCR